nr:hypothetical protein [Tanacetum cinerariifolium]
MVTVAEWSRGEEMMEVVVDGMTMWCLSSAVAGVGRNLAESRRGHRKTRRGW